MTYLNTERTKDGQKLTFPDGSDAGIIAHLSEADRFAHFQPSGDSGPERLCKEAAQFDALAWAADQEAAKRYAA